jgi:hypothetical protein
MNRFDLDPLQCGAQIDETKYVMIPHYLNDLGNQVSELAILSFESGTRLNSGC